jgi:hypothetical protein
MRFNLFGKKKQDSPTEAKWAVAQGEDNGLPLIFRVRSQEPHGIDISLYPNLMAVSWSYEPVNVSGMPPPDVLRRMEQFEDALDSELEAVQSAFLTVIVTGNGVREWQWYSRDTQETMENINKALSPHEPFPVEFSLQSDPHWEAYHRFQNTLG